jgi:hypothetical protein
VVVFGVTVLEPLTETAPTLLSISAGAAVVEVQESVAVLPAWMVAGEADRETVGGTAGSITVKSRLPWL